MAAISQITHLGEPGVLLAAGDLAAIAIPPAGMVIASLRAGGDELLGRADLLAGWVDGNHTMGIPLLHPWANRLEGTSYRVGDTTVEMDPASPLLHRDGNGLPIHGLLGASTAWRISGSSADDERARLEATLDAADVPGLLEAFPFPHSLALLIELTPGTLAISTTLTATGEVAVPIAFGWHPYLQLPRAARADWTIELPPMDALELDVLQLPTGVEQPYAGLDQPLGSLTLDDGFAGIAQGAVLAISAGGRRVAVSFDEGYPFGQAFAPSNQDVVALEPMTAPANALASGRGLVLAQPGASHTARFSLHVT
jgi:galactose mutarotase-like enzyme